GNAAVFATSQCLPLGMPDTLKKVPRMLLDPLGPIAIKPSYVLSVLPWLLRLLIQSRPVEVDRITKVLAALLARSLTSWEHLLGPRSADFVLRKGWLYVWENGSGYAKAARLVDARRSVGIRVEKVSKQEVSELEPALTRDIVGGYLYPDAAHTADPHKI